MEAAFEAVHSPDAAVADILRELSATPDDVGEMEQVPAPWAKDLGLYNAAITKLETAYADQQAELAALKAKPPKPHRTGAAARMNPDDIRLARTVLIGTALFGGAAFAVSFGGQLAMAPYSRLQPELHWFIPFMIEAPIILLSVMIAVFKRRKQSTVTPWIVMLTLTALSSAINVAHVYIESDGLRELGDWFGAAVMGIAPWLVLLLFEEFVRLAVKPTTETPEPAPAAPRRTTPNRKRATK
jgi:hypothetical protein